MEDDCAARMVGLKQKFEVKRVALFVSMQVLPLLVKDTAGGRPHFKGTYVDALFSFLILPFIIPRSVSERTVPSLPVDSQFGSPARLRQPSRTQVTANQTALGHGHIRAPL